MRKQRKREKKGQKSRRESNYQSWGVLVALYPLLLRTSSFASERNYVSRRRKSRFSLTEAERFFFFFFFFLFPFAKSAVNKHVHGASFAREKCDYEFSHRGICRRMKPTEIHRPGLRRLPLVRRPVLRPVGRENRGREDAQGANPAERHPAWSIVRKPRRRTRTRGRTRGTWRRLIKIQRNIYIFFLFFSAGII